MTGTEVVNCYILYIAVQGCVLLNRQRGIICIILYAGNTRRTSMHPNPTAYFLRMRWPAQIRIPRYTKRTYSTDERTPTGERGTPAPALKSLSLSCVRTLKLQKEGGGKKMNKMSFHQTKL
jgi:hypothetical protein